LHSNSHAISKPDKKRSSKNALQRHVTHRFFPVSDS
jgi:hypothetical protein